MWMDETTALKRIVILLLSLASLAERAANAPKSVRRAVLAFLRNGENAALSLVAEFSLDEEDDPRAFDSDSPADAVLLAARLRMLAFTVYFLMQFETPCAAPSMRSRGQLRQPDARILSPNRLRNGHAGPEFCDTS